MYLYYEDIFKGPVLKQMCERQTWTQMLHVPDCINDDMAVSLCCFSSLFWPLWWAREVYYLSTAHCLFTTTTVEGSVKQDFPQVEGLMLNNEILLRNIETLVNARFFFFCLTDVHKKCLLEFFYHPFANPQIHYYLGREYMLGMLWSFRNWGNIDFCSSRYSLVCVSGSTGERYSDSAFVNIMPYNIMD